MSDTMTIQNVQGSTEVTIDVLIEDIGFTCEACGRTLSFDDDERTNHAITDPALYCSDCWDCCYFTCYSCDAVFPNGEANEFGNENYCNSCFEEIFTTCDHCDNTVAHDETKCVRTGPHGRDEESWCESCTNDDVFSCECCCENYSERTVSYSLSNGDSICGPCYEESYFTCEGCEEVCHNDDYHEQGYCDSCWRERGLGKIQRLLDRLSDPEIRAVRVYRSDSISAGNCGPGTDDFIDEYFTHLYPWAAVTIDQIINAVCPHGLEDLADEDAEYAKQIGIACLHAVRRAGHDDV